MTLEARLVSLLDGRSRLFSKANQIAVLRTFGIRVGLPRAMAGFTDQSFLSVSGMFDEKPSHAGLPHVLEQILMTGLAGFETGLCRFFLGRCVKNTRKQEKCHTDGTSCRSQSQYPHSRHKLPPLVT
jgi:hypothetical protein